jgi:hypothetical protein
MSNKVPYYSDAVNSEMQNAMSHILAAHRSLELIAEGHSCPLFLEGVAARLAEALDIVRAVRQQAFIEDDLGFVFDRGYQFSKLDVKRD